MRVVLDFLFPARCRHCGVDLERYALLCPNCLEHVVFMEGKEESCHAYVQRACFEACGPILSLIHDKDPGVAKLLAALMVLQYKQIGWPECDGVAGRGLLGYYFSKLTGVKRAKKPWVDQELLVLSLRPLTYKERARLFRRFPKKLLNLSVI
ncbi:MAG TPA: double zinc ribbon domain-containing protein [Chlamydiales bacterium]|nr:double zinc ribbon domain-containing protein [Chlamydiales bacterium]